MSAHPVKRQPVNVRVPVRSRYEDTSRQQRGKCTDHLAHLLHAGPVVITRK